jgi:hypothetical protein
MALKSKVGRRSFLAGTVTAGAVAAMRVGHEASAEGTRGAAVTIELFTSQGCSSCPPADAVLGNLARRADIVALSFHVDYWNYIGWKDPFSSAQPTERQRAYARALNQNSIYTPEMVVDGLAHTPGVYQGKLASLIEQARQIPTPRATPILSLNGGNTLSVGLVDHRLDTRSADVFLALYDQEHKTPVPRGENEGRTLNNFNVVRRFEKIATWDGTQANLTIHDVSLAPSQGLAVLIQRPDNGPMIGSAKLEQKRVA